MANSSWLNSWLTSWGTSWTKAVEAAGGYLSRGRWKKLPTLALRRDGPTTPTITDTKVKTESKQVPVKKLFPSEKVVVKDIQPSREPAKKATQTPKVDRSGELDSLRRTTQTVKTTQAGKVKAAADKSRVDRQAAELKRMQEDEDDQVALHRLGVL